MRRSRCSIRALPVGTANVGAVAITKHTLADALLSNMARKTCIPARWLWWTGPPGRLFTTDCFAGGELQHVCGEGTRQ